MGALAVIGVITLAVMGTVFLNLQAFKPAAESVLEPAYNRVITTMILGGLVILVGLASLGFWMNRRIVKPLQLLGAMAQSISDVDLKTISQEMSLLAKGDLMRSVSISSQPLDLTLLGEVVEAGEPFNAMIVRLQETGKGFNEMTGSLRQLVGGVTEKANALNVASGKTAIIAQQTGKATSQIAVTIQQISRGTSQQTDAISKTHASVEQMQRAIDGVARGAQEQASSISQVVNLMTQVSQSVDGLSAGAIRQVEQTNRASLTQAGITQRLAQMEDATGKLSEDAAQSVQAAQQGAQVIAETVEGMQRVQTATDQLAQRVRDLGHRSGQIGSIIETIEDISSQTNLLALNAAIEAARAGEYGKGFAVVADEVRKLAERSSHATREISEMIRAVQGGANEVVEAMQSAGKDVSDAATLTNQAGDAFQSIVSGMQSSAHQAQVIRQDLQEMSQNGREMEQLVNNAHDIAETNRQVTEAMGRLNSQMVQNLDSISAIIEENTAATEEMAAGSNEVTGAMENIASVSEQNTAAVEEVSASTTEISTQVEQLATSAKALSDLVVGLEQAVFKFQIKKDTAKTARGSSLKTRLAFVRERYGSAALERVIQRTDPEAQRLLRGEIADHAEYSRDVYNSLVKAIKDELSGGKSDIQRDLTNYMAQKDLQTTMAIHYKAGDPAYTLKRLDVILRYYWGEVPVRVETIGPNQLRVKVEKTGAITRDMCHYNLPGWIDGAIEAAGAKPQVRKVKCAHDGDPCCEYDVSWVLR
jgi:methyl-accepting chemotaxis protein